MPGDELRHIDWRLYAKCDKYYVKLYEENTSLRSYLLLDVSKSMTFGEGPLNKLQYGKCIIALFGLPAPPPKGLSWIGNLLGYHPRVIATELKSVPSPSDGRSSRQGCRNG